MSLICSNDPCIFGPDIGGLSPPTRLWSLVPDHEHSGKPSQACDCFVAGQPSAAIALLEPAPAMEVFAHAARSLIEQQDHIGQSDASVILGLWRLPNDDVLFAAMDMEGQFAKNSLDEALAALPGRVLKSNILFSPAFDAAIARRLPGISSELSGALKFFST